MVSRDSLTYRRLRTARNVLNKTLKRLAHIDTTTYVHRTSIVSRDLVAEEYAFIGRDCEIAPMTFIGRYSMLASRVSIVGGDHIFDRAGSPTQFAGRPDQVSTRIARDVWIGRNATIMRGITVGEGAIIGTGAVVTKSVAPYTIVAGVPARQIGTRFQSNAQRLHHSSIINGKTLDPKFAERQDLGIVQ